MVRGGKDGASDVVRADVIHLAVLKHTHQGPIHADVLPDQARGTGDIVVEILGDPVARSVMDRMDRVTGLGQAADGALCLR